MNSIESSEGVTDHQQSRHLVKVLRREGLKLRPLLVVIRVHGCNRRVHISASLQLGIAHLVVLPRGHQQCSAVASVGVAARERRQSESGGRAVHVRTESRHSKCPADAELVASDVHGCLAHPVLDALHMVTVADARRNDAFVPEKSSCPPRLALLCHLSKLCGGTWCPQRGALIDFLFLRFLFSLCGQAIAHEICISEAVLVHELMHSLSLCFESCTEAEKGVVESLQFVIEPLAFSKEKLCLVRLQALLFASRRWAPCPVEGASSNRDRTDRVEGPRNQHQAHEPAQHLGLLHGTPASSTNSCLSR
mmetsp:Transcript_242/g.835  ORF Transcript_242/g.835 Transcript_242/m.835 type:complete len:307 (-) Transcript_242:15-935(-)